MCKTIITLDSGLRLRVVRSQFYCDNCVFLHHDKCLCCACIAQPYDNPAEDVYYHIELDSYE